MSRERIQEHFTDLYEGTLDPGLAQQIARRFEQDAELKADYAEFTRAMDLLSMMPDEEIEVPSFLSSRIAERLDASETKKVSWLSGVWLRNLSFGTLGLVAIVGGFLAIKNQPTDTIQASAVSSLPPAPRTNLDTLELKLVKEQPTLTYTSSGPKTVLVRSEDGEKILKRYELNGNPMECSLVNSEAAPAVFDVEATGDTMKHLFIVPGSSNDFEAKGQGSLVEFAKVVAVKYGKTIHLQFGKTKADQSLKWDVNNATAQGAVSDVLPGTEYSVSIASDGVLNVSGHR
jgi:hypothetical protein